MKLLGEEFGEHYDQQNDECPNIDAIFFMIYCMLAKDHCGRDVITTLNYLLLLGC